MKATAAAPISAPVVAERPGLAAVLMDLTKVRLTSLVLLTTLVGFYVGTRGTVDYVLLFHTMLGTALVASGAV